MISLCEKIRVQSKRTPEGCLEWLGAFRKSDGLPDITFEGDKYNPRTELFKEHYPDHCGSVFAACPHNNPKCIAPEHSSALKRAKSVEEKLGDYIVTENGCHILRNPRIKKNGYSYVADRDRDLLAHREAFRLRYPDFDEMLELDHLCCNKLCINPDHLEPVTHAENMRRAKEKGRMTGPKKSCDQHGGAKNNNAQVVEIMREIWAKKATGEIMKKWNYSRSTVNKIGQRAGRYNFSLIGRHDYKTSATAAEFSMDAAGSYIFPNIVTICRNAIQRGTVYLIHDKNGLEFYFGETNGSLKWGKGKAGWLAFVTEIINEFNKKNTANISLTPKQIYDMYPSCLGYENMDLQKFSGQVLELHKSENRTLDKADLHRLIKQSLIRDDSQRASAPV